MSEIKNDLRYADSHEWVALDGDVATVGITDYAQHALGDIVYVDMPEVGDTVTKGEVFGALESVKAASDLISPVTGEVIEVNEALEDEPGLINQEAYSNWIIRVKVEDTAEVEELLTPENYAKICEE